MAVKINGGQPGFIHTLNAVAICGQQFGLEMKRNNTKIRNNCGLEVVVGPPEYTTKFSGELEFGTGSTEATLWSHFSGGAAQAWTAKPSSAATGVANPLMSGTALADSYSMSLSASAPVSFDFAATGTDSTGLPTRVTS